MQVRQPRRGTQAWQALMAQFADSGLSAAAFCRREAIGVASFYQWRARLTASSGAAPVRSDRVATAGFVDIGTLHAGDPVPAAFELRLDLGGGLTLQLRRG
jgi:putative transposase